MPVSRSQRRHYRTPCLRSPPQHCKTLRPAFTAALQNAGFRVQRRHCRTPGLLPSPQRCRMPASRPQRQHCRRRTCSLHRSTAKRCVSPFTAALQNAGFPAFRIGPRVDCLTRTRPRLLLIQAASLSSARRPSYRGLPRALAYLRVVMQYVPNEPLAVLGVFHRERGYARAQNSSTSLLTTIFHVFRLLRPAWLRYRCTHVNALGVLARPALPSSYP